MDLEAAHAELTQALAAEVTSDRASSRLSAARQVLIARGAEALDLPGSSGGTLDEILGLAAKAAASQATRNFAVLLVHAISVEGLMPARGETERQTRLVLERALLNPLRRAGYPFDGSPYDKRQFLIRLHLTIEEHLRPLEPSIPAWIHGLKPVDR